MKLLLTSLAILLATSSLGATAPDARVQAATVATAPSAEQTALATRFVALTSPEKELMEMIQAGFLQGALSQAPDDASEAQLASFEKSMDGVFAKLRPAFHAQLPLLLNAYVQVYAREFSAEDLKQMIAFAETPGGRRYFSRAVMLENDPALASAQAKVMEAVMPLMEGIAKENCAKRAAAQLAAGDTKAKCPLSDQSETLAG